MKPIQEQIAIGPEASVRVGWRRSRSFQFEWHYHDEVELTLILQGSGRRYVGDSVDEYQDGDFILLGPKLPHTWETNQSTGGWHEALVAQFRLSDIGQWPELEHIKKLIKSAANGIQFGGIGTKVAAQRFRTVRRRRGLRQVLSVIELLHFLAVSRSVNRSPIASLGYVAPSSSRDERIQRVLLYLSEHYSKPLTQVDVGKLIEMSPASFARFFRQAIGKTFTQYVNQIRVAAACRHLAETDKKITDIALASGFNNLAHFNRTFLLLKKMTPSEYRTAYRREDVDWDS